MPTTYSNRSLHPSLLTASSLSLHPPSLMSLYFPLHHLFLVSSLSLPPSLPPTLTIWKLLPPLSPPTFRRAFQPLSLTLHQPCPPLLVRTILHDVFNALSPLFNIKFFPLFPKICMNYCFFSVFNPR